MDEVGKLMGLLNYYRRYIENFSRIAKPIYNLVKIPETDGKVKSTPIGKQLGGNNPVSLTSTHQSSLKKLIKCLVSTPVMAYPDPRSLYECIRGRIGSCSLSRAEWSFTCYWLWITSFNTSRENLPSTPGAGCIKKLLKLTMISGKVNQSEQRILYFI